MNFLSNVKRGEGREEHGKEREEGEKEGVLYRMREKRERGRRAREDRCVG